MSEHVVTDASAEIVATYNLCVVGPVAENWAGLPAELLPSFLRETEENLTDLLPDGYRVVIKEWCSE